MHKTGYSVRQSGSTLVELLIATGIALVGFLAVSSLNAANLRCVKSARQSNAATLCLQHRAEQLRLADWRKITLAGYFRDVLLATSAPSAAPLAGFSETVTVEAYPDASAAQKLIVRRNANGTRTILASGDGLPAERLARVEFLITWPGSDGRTRTRATTTLMANGGISRMNLPAFGAAAGSPTSSTTGTPAPSATPTPSATPSSTGTPTPTPTPTPANNGNGNGRGNVGGKSGKN